jgi:hypothetical protein
MTRRQTSAQSVKRMKWHPARAPPRQHTTLRRRAARHLVELGSSAGPGLAGSPSRPRVHPARGPAHQRLVEPPARARTAAVVSLARTGVASASCSCRLTPERITPAAIGRSGPQMMPKNLSTTTITITTITRPISPRNICPSLSILTRRCALRPDSDERAKSPLQAWAAGVDGAILRTNEIQSKVCPARCGMGSESRRRPRMTSASDSGAVRQHAGQRRQRLAHEPVTGTPRLTRRSPT